MKNVVEYLYQSVQKYAEKLAVADSVKAVTFSELWCNACKVRNSLKMQPVGGVNL